MFERLKEIICNYVEVEQDDIRPESRFMEDLGFTSFDFMSMLGELEDEFDVETEEELEEVKTRAIKDLYIIASVVDTPDFFEDRDHFEELVREIEEIVEMFEEDVQGYYMHEIQEDLKEFKKNYDLDEILSDNNSEETDSRE